MSVSKTPTHAGRIGVLFALLSIVMWGIAASLAGCSRNSVQPPRQVVFINFDHERARFAFARFVAACEALRIQDRHHVELQFVGVDVLNPLALKSALQRELEKDPVAIVAPTSPVLAEAVRLTTTTPIVFFTHQDPVDLKLGESLTHRRQNIAGISIYLGIEAKMLELLRETAPHAWRIGYIVDSVDALQPGVTEFLALSARRHGIEWKVIAVKSIQTFSSDVRNVGAIDAWFVTKTTVLDEHRMEFLATLAATGRPAIYPSQVDVAAGAPMAYEAVFDDPNGALARQLDRVLSGVVPGDIPVERPKRFTLSLNVGAARAAGMVVTSDLLSRADKVR